MSRPLFMRKNPSTGGVALPKKARYKKLRDLTVHSACSQDAASTPGRGAGVFGKMKKDCRRKNCLAAHPRKAMQELSDFSLVSKYFAPGHPQDSLCLLVMFFVFGNDTSFSSEFWDKKQWRYM